MKNVVKDIRQSLGINHQIKESVCDSTSLDNHVANFCLDSKVTFIILTPRHLDRICVPFT